MLNIEYIASTDETIAYIDSSKILFRASGEWSNTEVDIAMRILRRLPAETWNRSPETVQFAKILTMARECARIYETMQTYITTEIYASTADGKIVIDKKVNIQPQHVIGITVLDVYEEHPLGNYELVYDISLNSLLWQKEGETSANILTASDGKYYLYDETGDYWIYVKIDTNALPPESRTETIVVENLYSWDFLERVGENKFKNFLRISGESDAELRTRITNRLNEIKITKEGIKEIVKALIVDNAEISLIDEDYRNWAVIGNMAVSEDPVNDTYYLDTQNTAIAGDSSRNYFFNIKILDYSDAELFDTVDAKIDEVKPALRKYNLISGQYPETLEFVKAQEVSIPSGGNATLEDISGTKEYQVIKMPKVVDSEFYFTLNTNILNNFVHQNAVDDFTNNTENLEVGIFWEDVNLLGKEAHFKVEFRYVDNSLDWDSASNWVEFETYDYCFENKTMTQLTKLYLTGMLTASGVGVGDKSSGMIQGKVSRLASNDRDSADDIYIHNLYIGCLI